MTNKLSEGLSRFYSSDKLPWFIIFIGITLRVVRYIHNPSLYFDEAGSAVDISDRSLTDMIHPSPDAVSTYPSTFLILTKLAILFLGNTEYAFRLFPLLCGILALFLFYYVAKNFISPVAVPAALFLFAILDPLVYYSSILKPYSGDVTFALLMYASLVYSRSRNFDLPGLFLFTVMGAAAIWFSNSSVFILAAIGANLILLYLSRKDWSELGKISAVCFIWALSFGIYYIIFLQVVTANIGAGVEEVISRESALFPFPPTSLSDIKWFIDTFFNTFNFVDSFDFGDTLMLTGIAALLFLLGCVSMLEKNRADLFALISPILFTLAAAAMHKYPFKGRLILFLMPFLLIIIAQGIAYLVEKSRNSSKATAVIVIVFLLIYPVSWAAYHVKKPLSQGGLKPVLQYIKNNWQDGDILYVHFYAQYEFDYYVNYRKQPFSFTKDEYIVGIAPRAWYKIWRRQDLYKYYSTDETAPQTNKDKLNEYIKNLDKLSGHNRVWVLFTGNISSATGMKDNSFFLFQLDTKGEKLDSFKYEELASVYLYDLYEHPDNGQ